MNPRERYSTKEGITFSLPWNGTTAKSWVMSLLITSLLMLILTFVELNPPTAKKEKPERTIVMLQLGDRPGIKPQGGNAQKEGRKSKGNKPSNNLEDAKEQPKESVVDNQENVEFGESENIVPEDKPSVEKKSPSKKEGSDDRSIGSKKGEDDLLAKGLGRIGSGRGSGQGFGNINWDGGGNRSVLKKEIPKFPRNVNTSSKIVLQFNVLPNGEVTKIVPTRTGDPRLESAAITALRKWKFNPIDSNVVMVGEIPINFVVR